MGNPMVLTGAGTLSQSNYSATVYVDYPWVTQWSVYTGIPSPKVTIVPEYNM